MVGKGPDFGHAGNGGKREGMAETAQPDYPDRLLARGALRDGHGHASRRGHITSPGQRAGAVTSPPAFPTFAGTCA